MIKYKIYSHPDHCLTFSAKQLKLYTISLVDEDIKNTIINWEVAFADKIIIASEKDKLIGFFRYDLGDYKHNLYECGTYIIPEYRRRGLAFELWKQVFELEKPELVFGHVETKDGYHLYNKIKKTYKNVNYDFTIAQNVVDKFSICA